MGVFDKFLDIMKLNDDDYDDDEFYDDEDFEDIDEKPKKSFFSKKDKVEDYEDLDLQPEKKISSRSSNKITPMRQPASRQRTAGMEVCVVKPTSVDDSREITETLLDGRTVILNLEGLDLEIAQRIIDFTSGATFAISGNLQKISNYIFLVTPTNVDISGDLQDLLSSPVEMPSVKNHF